MICWSDILWFSELVRQIHACTDEADLFDQWTLAVHDRLRAVETTVEEVAMNLSTYAVHRMHGDWSPPSYYVAALPDNLLAIHVLASGGTGTFQNSLMVPRDHYERTNTCNLVYRPAGLTDVVIASSCSRDNIVLGFTMGRDRNFVPWERRLVELIRRHLEAAAIRVRSSRPGPSSAMLAEAQILLGKDHRPLVLSAWLQRFLTDYFPADRAQLAAGRLPEELKTWTDDSLARLDRRPPLHPLTCFRTVAARGALIVRLFPAQPHGGVLLRLTEERWPPNPLALRARGLSTRECEVLHWLAQGKRDAEIARILAISSGTVSKHVEHLLKKLRVESRSAAASVLWSETR